MMQFQVDLLDLRPPKLVSLEPKKKSVLSFLLVSIDTISKRKLFGFGTNDFDVWVSYK
jgi:hypothetical protein